MKYVVWFVSVIVDAAKLTDRMVPCTSSSGPKESSQPLHPNASRLSIKVPAKRAVFISCSRLAEEGPQRLSRMASRVTFQHLEPPPRDGIRDMSLKSG